MSHKKHYVVSGSPTGSLFLPLHPIPNQAVEIPVEKLRRSEILTVTPSTTSTCRQFAETHNC